MLEAKVHEQDVRMSEEINWRVALAITEMAQSGVLLDPNVVVSPSQCRSSCASIGVPDENMLSLPVVAQDNQRYPVDDITQCTSCELYNSLLRYKYLYNYLN